MTQKQGRKQGKAVAKQGRNIVQVTAYAASEPDPETRQRLGDEATAKKLTQPEVQAANVIQYFEGDNHEVNALIRELEQQVLIVKSGDLGRCEAMLIAHAHTLDEVFSMYARKAHANFLAGYGDAGERYMRLALKAQSQCRTTIEALAELKNPRSFAFVRQANIAHGPQQVNNGLAREEIERRTNELSSKDDELLPDGSTSHEASRIDTPVEAVGEVHRPSKRERQSQERPQ